MPGPPIAQSAKGLSPDTRAGATTVTGSAAAKPTVPRASRAGSAARVDSRMYWERSMVSQHILVVDDDPVIRETVADILDFEGYSIETATNGREALQAIERAQPSLVLLDMRMPVLDGWGFAREVKERGLDL